MVIQLIVTPGMIRCFHECTAKSDYKQLFEDYPQFFESLEENMWRIGLADPLFSRIIDGFNFFRNVIYEPNTRLPMDKWSLSPEFLPRLCLAMQTKNWDDFYEKYRPTIDFMIEEARSQKSIDLKIGFGPELYDTFSQRDQAANLLNQEKPVETPQNRVYALCSNGHSSPFDCNSNCIRFLQSLYGSKRINRKTAEKLVFTDGKAVKWPAVVSRGPCRPWVLTDLTDGESTTSTKPKSSKHVTFAEPETEKSEEQVILDIPKGIVASKVAEMKGIVRVKDHAVKHEIHTGINKKPEDVVTDIPIKLVPSSVPEVKVAVPPQIGSTCVPDINKLGSNNVSEIKETGPSRVVEVKQTIPATSTEVNEVAAETKQTVPTEIPMVIDLTRVTEVKATPKVSPEPKTEDFQLNQNYELFQMECRYQKSLNEYFDVCRIESDRNHKVLETRISFLEENLKAVEINQKTFDQKLQQLESRCESSMETKLKKFEENLASRIPQNKNEDRTKKLELLEEKLQHRELLLHQKIDEIKIREQTLDNRMNELMELMESKMANSGEKKFSDEPQDDDGNPEEKEIPEKTQEDIDFDKKLAEQLLDYEERLRRIQKKREEMNKDS